MVSRIIIILIIISASLGYSLYKKQSFEEQLNLDSLEILKTLPLGEFETLDGGSFDPHQLFANEKVSLFVVHFWGTWCAPCEAELPDLLNFIKRFENRNDVKFLLVAANDEKRKVEKHLKSLDIKRSPVIWLMDNKNVHRTQYGTTRVPETFVFSHDKTTLRKYTGPQEWTKPLFFQNFVEFIEISSGKM